MARESDEWTREELIDEGLVCMEYWPGEKQGLRVISWVECPNVPHPEGGPLCELHAAMAGATIAAGRKALK